jgi:hypothetical protein
MIDRAHDITLAESYLADEFVTGFGIQNHAFLKFERRPRVFLVRKQVVALEVSGGLIDQVAKFVFAGLNH